MSRVISLILLLAVVIALYSTIAYSAPQTAEPQSKPPFRCTGNTTLAEGKHAHRSCFPSCPKLKGVISPCLIILLDGPYCRCNDGYVFQNESSDLCIKQEDC